MRFEPLAAVFCGLVGAAAGIGGAWWYWTGAPRKRHA